MDGAEPPLVTFVDPAHQRLLAFGFARQGLLEHFNDIARREQIEALALRGALLGKNSIASITMVTWWCQACQPSA